MGNIIGGMINYAVLNIYHKENIFKTSKDKGIEC
jgi:hypothetical protein